MIAAIPDMIEALKRGDRNAQMMLYREYSKSMYNICFRMLQHKEEAQDALHDAFIEVFTKIGSFRGDATIGAWIKRIVVNKCINTLNKKNVFGGEITEEMYDEIGEEEEAQPVWDSLSVDHVKQAMAGLPDGSRTVFSLYAFENYSHREIAEIAGITESTSKTQYMRAKEKLKELLMKKTQ